MNKLKIVKGNIENLDEISIVTETGHIIKFKPKVNIFVNLDKEEDGKPFFFIEFPFEYKGTYNQKKHMSISKLKKFLKKREIDAYWKEMEKQGY